MIKTVLTDWHQLEVKEEAVPEIGEEEALIKLLYAGVCGTDMHVHAKQHKTATVPRVLGHEYCGKIAQVNSKRFPELQVGDYVTSHPLWACGQCKPCLTGNENVCRSLQIYGIHTDGCFAEYFAVPADKVYKINPEVDPVVAAQIEPLAVALHDVRLSEMKRGDRVLVISAGPIGLLIAMVARQAGAREVVLTEINEYRIQFAKSFGFPVLNPMEDRFEEKLMELTDGEGYDVVFEVSGTKSGTALMTKMAASRGMIVIVGVPGEPTPVDTGAFLAKELRAAGVRIHPQYDFKEAVDLVNSGVMNEDLKRFVTQTYPLSEIEEAIRFNGQDEAHFKVLLYP